MSYIHCLGPYITWLVGISLFSISANTYFPKTEQVKLQTESSFYCKFSAESDIKKIHFSTPEIDQKTSDQKRQLDIIFKDPDQNDVKKFDCFKEPNSFRCEWTAYNYILIPYEGKKISEPNRKGGEFLAQWHHNAFDVKGEQVFCYQLHVL